MRKVFNKRTDKSGDKEWREEYRKSKSIDYSCRNHGSCPWCQGNRHYGERKRIYSAQDELDMYEYFGDEDYDVN